ncbi:MAG: transposase [Rhodocyclaceae bacterium]|nr:transposase [Rhodocyclaceae bacterium]
MTYNALRKGRFSESNRAYFITAVVRGRRPVFANLPVARLLIREMRTLHDNGMVSSLAWVVMPEHLHWLFQLGDNVSLEKAVSMLKGRSSRQINRHLGHEGALWQAAFHDHALREEEDLREIARYIVVNPLRAGLVASLADYPHWDAVWL